MDNINDKIQLFEDRKIRTAWDEENEEWYFSITDVISVLTDSKDPTAYWRKLKQRLKAEGNETVTNCHGLKMTAADGKKRLTDVAYAKHAGRLNGYADGTFKGDNAITRAEVVTVVNRATDRKADEGYITKNVSVLNKFTDIRNNSMWYYADVMEAANTHLANSSNNTETWVK